MARMRCRRAAALLAVSSLLAAAPAAAARDGELDPSFGAGGLKRFSLVDNSGGEGAGALVLLSGGRIW